MTAMYAAHQELIAAQQAMGDFDLAERLDRCMTARRPRHYGDGWPFTCQSAACAWCRRAMIRSWWYACATGRSSNDSSAGLPDTVDGWALVARCARQGGTLEAMARRMLRGHGRR
jgi:hypothetical protein